MPELIHSELAVEDQQRLVRVRNDINSLKATLTRAQVRTAYGILEVMRDALSTMLDKADGKDA